MNQPELRDALFIGSDSRANFKNVIAKRSDLKKSDGGRLGPSQNGATLEAGTVLGLAATGGDAGFYKPYNDSNTDGSQTAVGVLEESTQVDAAGNGSEIAIIRGGILFKDLLIGLDAAAIADLKALSYVEHGTNLLSF